MKQKYKHMSVIANIYSTSVNGNGNGGGGGNGNGHKPLFRKFPISFLSHIFNISPSQWSRVTECWLITFFFKIGGAIGWTVVTAAFISKYGIAFLPALFILNAFLIMVGTFIFEKFIMRIKREVLMILMLLLGGICLFFATFLYSRSPPVFFSLIIIAESIFFAQFNVFIPILVGDRFTPLESQKTFPFVESAETIGGMLGGTLVGIFASRIPIPYFLYLWILFLVFVVLVFIITSYVRTTLPPLPFRVNSEEQKLSKKDQIRQIFTSIRQMPFLKGLIVIVLLQWVFMNILEFQYTKAIEQTVTNKPEATIALHKQVKESLTASVIGAGETEKSAVLPANGKKQPETQKKREVAPETSAPAVHVPSPQQQVDLTRSLTPVQEEMLAKKLGTWKGLFHAGALIAQALLASRFITSLGVVGSMLLHPIIMLMSLVGMFLKFGFTSSIVTRMSFEVTNVVHKNAYFASHYALPKTIRDQAAEFLEGMVRPMGTVIGMLFLMIFQIFFAGKELSMWIHILMVSLMFAVLFATIKLQSKYTEISRRQLFSNLPYPEKINAIEILAQRGHSNAPFILVEKLSEALKAEDKSPNEHPFVRIKLLNALGQYHDSKTLPEILDALYDNDPDVRLEAAHALMNFYDIGEKFYTQAFSRYRMIEILKDVFRREKSSSVRSAIIRVFSVLRQSDVVPFLLEVLKENEQARADCIFTIGLFKDPTAAYYIYPYLVDQNSFVKANSVVALWQFPKYKHVLEGVLTELLESNDQNNLKAGIFVLGELGLPRKGILLDAIRHGDTETQLEAAFALTKCGDPVGFNILLEKLLSFSSTQFESMRRFFHRLRPKARRMVEQILVNSTSDKLHMLMREQKGKCLDEIDPEILEKLRRLYKLLGQHEELFAIEEILAQKFNAENKLPADALLL